jgi:hypothetical protein
LLLRARRIFVVIVQATGEIVSSFSIGRLSSQSRPLVDNGVNLMGEFFEQPVVHKPRGHGDGVSHGFG